MQELTAICPNCSEEIILDFTPTRGETVYCPQCGVSSEVIHTDPIAFLEIEEDEDFPQQENTINPMKIKWIN